MTQIKFNSEDIVEMQQFYREELSKALRRVEHFKNVLNTLEGKQPEIVVSASQNSNDEVAAGPAPVSSTPRKKKRGRKSFWDDLVLKRFRQLGKPLTYEQLTDEIMVFGKIPAENREKTRLSIISVIHRMRNNKGNIKTFSIGQKEKYIAPKAWFDESGNLKQEYKQYLPLKQKATYKSSTSGKGRGRPKGSKNKPKA